ncbi:MAG: CHAT domain-containing protein (plasmid) [Leptolyngbya sp. BL-A-14]
MFSKKIGRKSIHLPAWKKRRFLYSTFIFLVWVVLSIALAVFIQEALVQKANGLESTAISKLASKEAILSVKVQKDVACIKPKDTPSAPKASDLYKDIQDYKKALQLFKKHKKEDKANVSELREIAKNLASTAKKAEEICEPRAESYALGFLGEAYEQAGLWAEASDLTQKALRIAESFSDREVSNGLAYQWQWQLGRIYRDREDQKKNTKQAVAYYGLAVNTLNAVRAKLVSIDSDTQIKFLENVEPIYREYVSLLLDEYVGLLETGIDQQANLEQARVVISSLQASELASFLEEPCPINRPEFLDNVVDKKDETAALFYPIVLEKRIAVILKLPKQKKLHYYDFPVDTSGANNSFEHTLEALQASLEEAYTFKSVKALSKQVYSWLIQGAEKHLIEYAKTHNQPIKTLVFVLDTPLRNIPLAALYDGKQYLIEKYAVAIAPRLELPDLRPLSKRRLSILAAGLTEPPPKEASNYGKLLYVKAELESIRQTGARVEQLLDKEFTLYGFNKKLNSNSFQIVHLATHGQFSSNPDETFILSADSKIQASKNTNQLSLDEMFRAKGENDLSPIELLVLNACETATGDGRETLGISGISVKAGVRSAIASLWTLSDEISVDFTKQLYRHLRQPSLSKAEALQRTQQALLKDPRYEHPRYWAPYILVGNWL